MKKISAAFFGLAFFLVSASFAGAATYTFRPTSSELWNLEHGYYYTWGINWAVPDNEEIIGASLLVTDIEERTNSANDLYGHLLDVTSSGVNRYQDTPNTGDEFENQSPQPPLLFHWQNLSNQPQDILHTFDSGQIGFLKTYIGDGSFGLGFDPDCVFIDTGVILTIETANAPVPASLLLLGSGLLGLAGFRRKIRKE